MRGYVKGARAWQKRVFDEVEVFYKRFDFLEEKRNRIVILFHASEGIFHA